MHNVVDEQELTFWQHLQLALAHIGASIAESGIVRWFGHFCYRLPSWLQTTFIVCVFVTGFVPMVIMGIFVAAAEKLCSSRWGLLAAQYIGSAVYGTSLAILAYFSTTALVLLLVTACFFLTSWFITTVPAPASSDATEKL